MFNSANNKVRKKANWLASTATSLESLDRLFWTLLTVVSHGVGVTHAGFVCGGHSHSLDSLT